MRVGTDEVREQSKGSGALTEDKGAGPKTRVLRPHARSTFDAKDTVEMDLAIEVEGVSKRFGAKKALDDVSLRVGTGKVLALLGPNGAGKTTLVRVLTTLLLPDSGRARVAGFDVERDAKTIRSMIGLAGQYATVDEMLTGRENLELVGLLYHLSKGTYRRRAKEALERMTLTEAGDKPVKTYSGGMKRRLDLAASLIGRPPVLFLDEPTTGLDPRTRNDLWQFIEELVAEGTTVLLTTQYMEEAERLASGIVVIDGGRVVAQGTADQLKDKLGGDVLEVRVKDRADLERAKSLVADLGVARPRLDADPDLIRLAIKGGTKALITAGRALDDGGIALEDIGIRRPSLDDVFLAITEHTGATEKTGAKANRRAHD
jgi:ABC-2 type transport system ATP-binding protein